jgi:hypothetical protein
MMRREGRGAIVLAACVPSHWLLDYVMHRPDMPLYPGGARYGLGLWNSLEVTLAKEFGMFAVGAAIYLSSTRAKDRTGVIALWSLLFGLASLYLASVFGPPPPSVRVLAASALIMWVTIPGARGRSGTARPAVPQVHATVEMIMILISGYLCVR